MLHISKKFYMTASVFIFFAAGLLHGLRVYLGWDIMIGPWVVPIWISLLVVLVLFLMVLAGIRYLV